MWLLALDKESQNMKSENNEDRHKKQLMQFTKEELVRLVLDMFPDFEGDY